MMILMRLPSRIDGVDVLCRRTYPPTTPARRRRPTPHPPMLRIRLVGVDRAERTNTHAPSCGGLVFRVSSRATRPELVVVSCRRVRRRPGGWCCCPSSYYVLYTFLIRVVVQSCIVSCIFFASLYGKTRVARDGNNEEINFRPWKNSWEIPRTKCTQFPRKEIKLYAIST